MGFGFRVGALSATRPHNSASRLPAAMSPLMGMVTALPGTLARKSTAFVVDIMLHNLAEFDLDGLQTSDSSVLNSMVFLSQ